MLVSNQEGVDRMLTTLAENVSLLFSFTTLTGDVQYDDENHMLNLVNEHGEEVMTVDLDRYGFTARDGRVFIKDWSEHTNLARSLEQAGLVEIVRALNVGPHRSRAYEVRVLAREAIAA